jgi:hypothetical protein
MTSDSVEIETWMRTVACAGATVGMVSRTSPVTACISESGNFDLFIRQCDLANPENSYYLHRVKLMMMLCGPKKCGMEQELPTKAAVGLPNWLVSRAERSMRMAAGTFGSWRAQNQMLIAVLVRSITYLPSARWVNEF